MTDRATVQRASAEPLLSIVVPIHNVAAYLDECLESITAQAVQDFEVIMVDDGSTDSSGDIAARWAASDDRFCLIRQENHGLGHARNSGAANVKGRYLVFLDSDDRVPEDAYQRMIEALERTGSDFATGNVHRFDSSGDTWQAPLYRGMAKVEELSTHVTRNYELLRDHLAHNKVWRTAFWNGADLQFPVGVLYEDVPTTIPAHVLARSVDVVPVVAILWRVRDQGDSSITQSRHQEARHLRDRVDGMLTASRFIGEHASQELKDAYDCLALSRDLRWYVDLYPDVDTEYQDEVFSSVGRFLEQASTEAFRRTPTAMRIAYDLLRQGARRDFAAYVDLRRSGEAGDLPLVVRDGRAVFDIDLPDRTPIAIDACDATDELRVVSRTSSIDVDDRHLVIEGWAYISRLPIVRPQSIRVWLEGDDRSIDAEVTYRRDDRAIADVGRAEEASGNVAFTARVPFGKLLRRRWRPENTTRTVWISVSNSGVTRADPLASPLVGVAERPYMAPLRGRHWLRVCWTDEALTCRVRPEEALLTDVTVDGAALTFTLQARSKAGAALRLRHATSKEGRNYGATPDGADRGPTRVRLPVADLPAAGDGRMPATWELLYRGSDSDAWKRVLDPIGVGAAAVRVGDAELSVRRSRAATVTLERGEVLPSVNRVAWGPQATLIVELTYAGDASAEAVVVEARQQSETVSSPITVSDGVLTAELPLGGVPRFGETIPLRAGTWDVKLRTSAGDLPVRIGPGLLAQLPQDVTVADRQYTVTDRARQNLSVIVVGDLPLDARGNKNQTRLRTEVYPGAMTGLRDVVLYESYYGKAFSDSPREIFAELAAQETGLEHVVAVRDQQFKVPAGARPVVYRSEEYYKALAQARYVVANTHLPNCFRRAPGQVVLQTWHGVGTKKIGLDMDSVQFANKAYIENIRNGESDNWDYLVSPNPFTSRILTRAFAYKGALLETGAPRNDIFHRPERAASAARIRERLGIGPDKKVVMYAPTWRDNVFSGPGRYRLDLRFDLHQAARKLGEEYAIVFRTHSNVVDRLSPGDGAVVDASDYPEVQELLLITDILISDYSTLMCDFSNTGRPMLFYTYDLANYRDVLRGFYFDFENEVPGPLITDEADLVSAIVDADRIRADYDEKYQKFAERFCPWDNGQATQRVLEAVLGDYL